MSASLGWLSEASGTGLDGEKPVKWGRTHKKTSINNETYEKVYSEQIYVHPYVYDEEELMVR